MATLLTTLDTILDTKLPTLKLLDERINTSKNLREYYTRRTEKVGHISSELFDGLFVGRDKYILRLSKPTSIAYLLYTFFTDMLRDSVEEEESILYVNHFPYILTEQELNGIRSRIFTLVPNVDDIVFKNEALIDGKWLVKNIDLVVDYDGLQMINNYISNGTCEEHSMIGITWKISRIIKEDVVVNDDDFDKLIEQYLTVTNIID